MRSPAPLAFYGFGFPELLVILLLLGGLAFWVWMIVDCATKEESAGSKVAWIVVLLLVGIIVAPLYFFVRKLPRKREPPSPPPL